MRVIEAQADLRRAYADGGPGVVISGLIWLAAWVAEDAAGVGTGFAVLFFGGMTIYPLALLANRVVLRRAKEDAGNPGGTLVLESTIAMIAGLIAAWLFLGYAPELVMPLAAIMVGTHYFAFRTAYGMTSFWLLALLVTAIGIAGLFASWLLFAPVTLLVALVEMVFGLVLTVRGVRA